MDGFVPGIGSQAGEGWFGPDGFHLRDEAGFRKAVTAGYGTDVATFTGGRALQLQSIEESLLATIPQDEDFVIFNMIDSSPATATVDEYVKQTDIGGFPGSTFNSETGDIAEGTGEYDRQALQMKYQMSLRKVTAVQEATKAIVDAIAREKLNGARRLKQDAEYCLIYGDDAVNPVEFPGLITLINRHGDSSQIVDVAGGGLSYQADELQNLAALVRGQGHYGRLTDYFCSQNVQVSEINQRLAPAYRVAANPAAGLAGLEVGMQVNGINAGSNTIIKAHEDIFIEEGQAPWEARAGALANAVTNAGLTPPTSVTPVAAGSGAGGADSKWLTTQAGLYYYGVESTGKPGRSTCVVTTQVTVAQGDAVTLTIVNPSDADVTGFVIHRGRRNGTNAKTDLRQAIRIPRQSGANTVFVDKNADVPGTSIVLAMNLKPGEKAVTYRRLLGMSMFKLYPTTQAVYPWAQIMFGALRAGKIEHVVMVKNICPRSQVWRPF